MTNFVIENMDCGGCAKGVTATLKQADPAAEVAVKLDTKEVSVSGGRATNPPCCRPCRPMAGGRAPRPEEG